MNIFTHYKMGHYLQNEMGADGGDGGGSGGTDSSTTADTGDSAEGGGDGGNGEQAASDSQAAPTTMMDMAVDDADGEQAAAADADDASSQIPEKYELALPENYEADESALERLHDVFKRVGLTTEQAQLFQDELIKFEAERQLTDEQRDEYMRKAVQANSDRWQKESMALPDIGGENFKASLKTCQALLAKHGTQEFRELMAYTGLGSHPEFFRFVHSVASAFADDNLVTGNAAPKAAEPMTLTDAFR